VADHATGGDGRLRLFVGIGLPDRIAMEAADATASLRGRYPDARWVPEESLHVTLAFLGSVARGQRPWIEDRVREVAATTEAFPTAITGVGGFPSMAGARVLWLGLDDPGDRCGELARAVQEALSPTFPVESRAFTPHITVARSPRSLDLRDPGDTAPSGERFDVDGISVFRSHLGRPEPRYEELAAFPFLGPVLRS
jgi:RNA 2',3'-cyclic 3'-phosphodiesterase